MIEQQEHLCVTGRSIKRIVQHHEHIDIVGNGFVCDKRSVNHKPGQTPRIRRDPVNTSNPLKQEFTFPAGTSETSCQVSQCRSVNAHWEITMGVQLWNRNEFISR